MHRSITSPQLSDDSPTKSHTLPEPTRREFLTSLSGAAALAAISGTKIVAESPESPLNVARVAVPSSRSLMSENKISALNDGFVPSDSFDRTHALYAMWVDHSAGEHESWVQYEWSEAVSVNKVEIYWAAERPRFNADRRTP